jgi:hypothetical protein
MKNTSLKKKLVAALLLASAGHAGIASAFTMLGSKTKIRTTVSVTPPPPLPPPSTEFLHSGALGAAAWATDVWEVVCPATTVRLATQLLDSSPLAAPLLSVQAIKVDNKATSSTDPSNGNNVYSPLVSITGSAGTFYVLVDKTLAGTKVYTVDIECKNSANEALAATSVQLKQDN